MGHCQEWSADVLHLIAATASALRFLISADPPPVYYNYHIMLQATSVE